MRPLLVALLASLGAAGCRGDAPPAGASRADGLGVATASGSAAGEGGVFTDEAAAAGLQFSYFNGMSGQFYFPEMLPGGAALFDYDNDGDLDLYLVQGEMLGEGRGLDQALFKPVGSSRLQGRLFRNDLSERAEGVRFTDVTDQSGIDARGYGMGAATGDFDNDGCVDLYLTFFGRNRLYRNDCDGTFTDVGEHSGTGLSSWSVSASFFDADRDGWLDLYVGTYSRYDLAADQTCTGLTGRRDYCTPAVYDAEPDRFFHNNGDGTFADVTASALIGGVFGPALGVSTADFNKDGWIDVYVANDGHENLLWINQRDGTFRNMGLLSGAALALDGKPRGSMGVDAGDFDNDGDEDLVTTQLPSEGSSLYVNGGSGLFEDASGPSGIGPLSLGYTGFGTAWLDYDNDGWLDLFAVNGAIEAIRGRNGPFPYAEPKLLFHNLRDGRFEDVSRQAGAVLGVPEVARGAAFGDVDNDGDVDVLVNSINGPARLLVNNVGNRRHWVGLRVVGARGSRDMLGASVEIVRRDGLTLWRRVHADASYASANDPRVLAGLDDSTDAPTIRVHWPEGGVEEWEAVAVDRWTTLKQGEGRAP